MSSSTLQKWVVCRQPRPEATLRLFCAVSWCNPNCCVRLQSRTEELANFRSKRSCTVNKLVSLVVGRESILNSSFNTVPLYCDTVNLRNKGLGRRKCERLQQVALLIAARSGTQGNSTTWKNEVSDATRTECGLWEFLIFTLK